MMVIVVGLVRFPTLISAVTKLKCEEMVATRLYEFFEGGIIRAVIGITLYVREETTKSIRFFLRKPCILQLLR